MATRYTEPEPGAELDFDEESPSNRKKKRSKTPRRKGDLQIDGTSAGVLETDRYFADFAGDALANREEIKKLTK